MAIYVGVLEMFAGENKTINASPPAADIDTAPDISNWTLAATFTWTDGSGSFEKDYTAFAIDSPKWTLTLDRDDTLSKGGKRLKFQVRRVDDGSNTELDWGYINVLP